MAHSTERIPLLGNSPGTERHLLVHRFGAPGSGPKAYLQASIHADETPAMLTLHHLARLLTAADAEGAVRGEIVLVPYANPIGLAQFINGDHSGRYDMAGGGNFNRNWPDLFEGLPEALEGKLGADPAANVAAVRAALLAALEGQQAGSEMQSLRLTLARLAADADLVLDVHCDDEALMHLFLIPAHWPQGAPLAAELGCAAVMLAEDSGGGSFDECFSTPWTKLQTHFPDHPIPPACLSATVELRGYGDVSDELAEGDARALFRSLQHLGHLAGDPGPAPAPLCDATPLEGVEFLRAERAGILAYRVALGDRVKKGDIVAWQVDPAAEDPEAARHPLRAGTDGLVLSRRTRKYVAPGNSVGKIVGAEPLPGRKGANLLSD